MINKFINNVPKNRREKELLILVFIGALILSTIILYTYIIETPIKPSDFPTINITYNDKPDTEKYTDCIFELESEDESERITSIQAMIKIRGGNFGASSYPKKGYRLKLSEEKSLLGMSEDDDWVLLSMYLDYPRMRIKMSLGLWDSLKPINPTTISLNSEYVCVFLNGEFEGLYLLLEKYDRRFLDLDDAQNNIDSSLIFQAKGATSFQNYDFDRWEQDWPNEYDGYYIMDEILINLTSFISATSDDVFFDPSNGIYSKFDKLNLIDFFIFNFYIDHRDFWSKNYYLVRNCHPNKFYLIPLDFDGSFGQYGWNIYDVDANPETFIREKNKLFERLINNDEFRQNCKNRWMKLREEHWTEEYLLDMFSDIYVEIKSILEIDAHKWDPYLNVYFNEEWRNEVKRYLNIFLEYIPERLEFCDLYFAAL